MSIWKGDFNFQKEGNNALITRINNGEDDKIISDLAKANGSKWMDANYSLWFSIYTLQHRYNYSLGEQSKQARVESYCIQSPTFFNKIRTYNNFTQITEGVVDKDYPKWIQDDSGEEKNVWKLLDGNNSKIMTDTNILRNYKNSGNIRTAAALYGSFLEEPIIYKGYKATFDGGGRTLEDKTTIGGSALTSEQYSIYTRGGAPIDSNNWLIVYNEHGIGYQDYDEKKEEAVLPYRLDTTTLNGKTVNRFIIVLNIHIFLPSGGYVRTRLDRSGRIFPNEFSLKYWGYEDYANKIARNAGQNFAIVWNSIIDGTYKKKGATKNARFEDLMNGSSDLARHWNTGMPNDLINQISIPINAITKSGGTYNPRVSDFSGTNTWNGGYRKG